MLKSVTATALIALAIFSGNHTQAQSFDFDTTVQPPAIGTTTNAPKHEMNYTNQCGHWEWRTICIGYDCYGCPVYRTVRVWVSY